VHVNRLTASKVPEVFGSVIVALVAYLSWSGIDRIPTVSATSRPRSKSNAAQRIETGVYDDQTAPSNR
jgi:hypothetical protein